MTVTQVTKVWHLSWSCDTKKVIKGSGIANII